jgi:hypothetical protein
LISKRVDAVKNIGIGIIALLSIMDEKILVTNDKKKLINKNWTDVVKYISNPGIIIQNFRKVLTYIDNGHAKPGNIKEFEFHYLEAAQESTAFQITQQYPELNYILEFLKAAVDYINVNKLLPIIQNTCSL